MKVGRFALRAAVPFALLAVVALGLFNVRPAQAADNAFVRVVHAAPAAENVDVYVDDGAQPLLSGFTFGTVTDYVPLAAGSHKIQVVPAGQGKDKAVITQTVEVQAGKYYTAAAIGDASTSPALVAFADDNSVTADKAKVRVYHLSSDAGAVSVATGGNTVINQLSFKEASDYLTVPPGSYTFQVTLLDKNNQQQSLDATLDANKVTSVFAVGLVGGQGATAFKFVPKVAEGVPTGMPSTGFAPQSNDESGIPAGVYLLAGLAALTLLGGTRFALARRRAR